MREDVTLGMLSGMADTEDLLTYLQRGRDAVVWKLDGASEYDIRRPLTSTGTNLLGIVKHLAMTEAGYLGSTFGRPFPEPIPWSDPTLELNADMWATPDQSRDSLIDLYRRVNAHADETVRTLGPRAEGTVPWWTAKNPVTVEYILVHLIAETHRHAGHADIVRELADGSAGLAPGNSNLADGDADWWGDYRSRVADAASEFL